MIVISNQAGVGKGLLTESDLADVTQRFTSALEKQGARLDAVYYCPHRPDQNCSCRKPAPGLLNAAAKDWSIDLRKCVFIGDSESDLRAAAAVGCPALQFAQTPDVSPVVPHRYREFVHNSLSLPAAVRLLLRDVCGPARENERVPLGDSRSKRR